MRRRGGDLSVSLFPFLSILACVIGVLSLLLASLAVGAVGLGPFKNEQLRARLSKAKGLLAEDRKELEGLSSKLAATSTLQKELRDAEDALVALGVAPGLSEGEVAEIIRLRTEIAAQKTTRTMLANEDKTLRAEREVKTELLAGLNTKRGAPPILVDPHNIGRDQEPYFVETRAGGLLLHRVSDDWTFFIPKSQIRGESRFKVFLRRMRAVRGGIVVFLVRPDGVTTLRLARRVAEGMNVRVASLPLPGEGDLDFALFRGAAGGATGDASPSEPPGASR